MLGKIEIYIQFLDGRNQKINISPYDPIYSIGEILGLNKGSSFPYLVLHNGLVLDNFLSLHSQNIKNMDSLLIFTFPETNYLLDDSIPKTNKKIKDKIDQIFAEALRLGDIAQIPFEYSKPEKRKKKNYKQNDLDIIIQPTILSQKPEKISSEELPKLWDLNNNYEPQSATEFDPNTYIDYLFASRR